MNTNLNYKKMNEEMNEFEKENFEKEFGKAYDEKQSEFEKLTQEKLIISLIGNVNSGKSQTINALTGLKYADVKARSGWTKNVSLYPLNNNVLIADTPGLNDINKEISQKATDFVKGNSDIILFFINAAVGITKDIKDAFINISKLEKEIIIIVNKIDVLDEEEKYEVINQIREETGITPIAISAKKNYGIEELNNKIIEILEKRGKELLFIKISRFKDKKVKNWIVAATSAAFGIGVIPIPGSDIIPLTTLQVGLAMKIAYIYDIKPTKSDVMKLIASTITGSVGKQAVRWAVTGLKGLGWIPGAQLFEFAASGIAATVAASLTYGFGWACNEYYKSGMNLELGEVSEIFNNYYTEYKKNKQ